MNAAFISAQVHALSIRNTARPHTHQMYRVILQQLQQNYVVRIREATSFTNYIVWIMEATSFNQIPSS